jgi:hypothetical protein
MSDKHMNRTECSPDAGCMTEIQDRLLLSNTLPLPQGEGRGEGIII